MSFNIDNMGEPICMIKGGKYNKTKIYISDDIETDNKLKRNFSKLKIEDGLFQIIPNNKSRMVGMITGASGSGKSHFIKNYCIEYHQKCKDRPIYLFSNLTSDETLDPLNYIKRIIIDESLIDDPITVEDFKNCLVLFDDIDVIRDKQIKNAVYQILNEILETGRHMGTSCLMTVHYPNGNNIKTLLNECHFYCYFPWGATRANNYVLENYLGVDKNDIKKIKSTKSRWACVFKNFPQAVICEKNIFMLSNED